MFRVYFASGQYATSGADNVLDAVAAALGCGMLLSRVVVRVDLATDDVVVTRG